MKTLQPTAAGQRPKPKPHTPPSTQARQRMWMMASILLLAAVLRLLDLGGESLDGDEIWVALDMQYSRFSPLLEKQLYDPVLFAVTWFSTRLLGTSSLAFRLPAALAGILGIALMYAMGKRLLGWRTGLVAAFLLATSLFHITLSRTARYYPLFLVLTLCVMLSSWAFARGRLRAIVGVVFFNVLNYYNHSASLLVLLSSLLFLASVALLEFVRQRRTRLPFPEAARPLLVLGLGIGLIALLLLPNPAFNQLVASLPSFMIPGFEATTGSHTPIRVASERTGMSGSWPLVPAGGSGYLGIGLLLSQTLADYSLGMTLATLALFLLALVGLARAWVYKRRAALLLSCLLAPPILAQWAGLFDRVILPEYFMGLYAAYLLLAAYGTEALWAARRVRLGMHFPFRWESPKDAAPMQHRAGFPGTPPSSLLYPTLGLALLILFSISSLVYGVQHYPEVRRTDWQAAGRYLGQNVTAEDLVIVAPNMDHSTEHLLYYWDAEAQQAEVLFLKDVEITHAWDRLKATGPKRVWWVLWTGYDDLAMWQAQGYAAKRFTGITVLHREAQTGNPTELARDGQQVLGHLARTFPFTANRGTITSLSTRGHIHSILSIIQRNQARCELALGQPTAALSTLDNSASNLLSAVRIVGRVRTYAVQQMLAVYELYREIGGTDGADRAEHWYSQLVAEFPRAAWLSLLRGRIETANGQLAQAIAAFRDAVALSPNAAPYRVALAQALWSQGETDPAAAELRRAIEYEAREEWSAYPLLAEIYRAQGRPDAAIGLYREAVQRAPYMLQPRLALGDLLYSLGRYQEAAVEYQAALSIYEPSKPGLLYIRPKLARAWAAGGAPLRAIQYLQASIHNHPRSAGLSAGLGEIYVLSGEAGSAIEAYRRAVKLAPQDTHFPQRLAELLAAAGRYGEASSVFFQAAARWGRSAWPYLRLCELYATYGNCELAMAAYQRAAMIEPLVATHSSGAVPSLGGLCCAHLPSIPGEPSPRWRLDETLPWAQVSAGTEDLTWHAGQWMTAEPGARALIAATDLQVEGAHHPGSVLFHPPNSQRATAIVMGVPGGTFGSLLTSFGLADDAASQSNGVRYILWISTDGGMQYTKILDTPVLSNRWESRRIDLSAYLAYDLQFRLAVDPLGDYVYDWLVITFELQPAPPG